MQQKYLLESFIMKSRNLRLGNEMCQLSNPYLQFRYDLGSGLANITAPPLDGGGIKLDSWHHVTITRNGPHGTIQVIFLSCCNSVPTREHPQKFNPNTFLRAFRAIKALREIFSSCTHKPLALKLNESIQWWIEPWKTKELENGLKICLS